MTRVSKTLSDGLHAKKVGGAQSLSFHTQLDASACGEFVVLSNMAAIVRPRISRDLICMHAADKNLLICMAGITSLPVRCNVTEATETHLRKSSWEQRPLLQPLSLSPHDAEEVTAAGLPHSIEASACLRSLAAQTVQLFRKTKFGFSSAARRIEVRSSQRDHHAGKAGEGRDIGPAHYIQPGNILSEPSTTCRLGNPASERSL